jgi:hypothetical protein
MEAQCIRLRDLGPNNGVFARGSGLPSTTRSSCTRAAVARFLVGRLVTREFFSCSASALLGRIVRSDDDRPGAPRVIVLGHALWRPLGADPKVIGRRVTLGDQGFEIAGSCRSGFAYEGGRAMDAPRAGVGQIAEDRNA